MPVLHRCDNSDKPVFLLLDHWYLIIAACQPNFWDPWLEFAWHQSSVFCQVTWVLWFECLKSLSSDSKYFVVTVLIEKAQWLTKYFPVCSPLNRSFFRSSEYIVRGLCRELQSVSSFAKASYLILWNCNRWIYEAVWFLSPLFLIYRFTVCDKDIVCIPVNGIVSSNTLGEGGGVKYTSCWNTNHFILHLFVSCL